MSASSVALEGTAATDVDDGAGADDQLDTRRRHRRGKQPALDVERHRRPRSSASACSSGSGT